MSYSCRRLHRVHDVFLHKVCVDGDRGGRSSSRRADHRGAWIDGVPNIEIDAHHQTGISSVTPYCDDIPGATTSSYTVTPADLGLKLRANVTASNGLGSNQTASSMSAAAVAERPAPQSPLDQTSVRTLTPPLKVNDISGTVSYEFHVAQSQSFSFINRSSGWRPNTNTYTIDPLIPEGSTYYWRARTHQNGHTSAWSTARKFTANTKRYGVR
jgi:hypothetical protein